MFYPEIIYAEPVTTIVPTTIGACLVAGCSCKDACIVSHRRAAFFAALARRTGETADRVSPSTRPGCCRWSSTPSTSPPPRSP